MAPGELKPAGSTPMASRRIRRHGTGNSNTSERLYETTNSHYGSMDRVSSAPAVGGTALIRCSQLVKGPPLSARELHSRKLSEGKTSDRATVNKVYDKVWHAHKTSFVYRVLRAYDPSGQHLSHEQLRQVMERLNMGLDEAEKERVTKRLDPDGKGFITHQQFMDEFAVLQPLGPHNPDRKQYNLTNRMPWESRCGQYKFWNLGLKGRLAGINDDAADGSYEQKKEDAFLLYLIANKMTQHKERIRLLFRQMDENRNSLVDKHEFVKAIQKLKMSIGPRQIERLFEIIDYDQSGCINYEEFIKAFDSETPIPKIHPKHTITAPGSTLAETLSISEQDSSAIMRNPLVHDLKRALYARASRMHDVFKQYDVNGDGYLSVDELAQCCGVLVPGIQRHDVASLLVHIDGSGDGYMDYKEFVRSLMEEDRHTRHGLLPSPTRATLGQSPIWTTPTIPRSVAEGSLAGSALLTSPRQAPSEGPGSPQAGGPAGDVGDAGSAGASWTQRSALDDIHNAAIAPVIESLGSSMRGSGGAAAGPAKGWGTPLASPRLDASCPEFRAPTQQPDDASSSVAAAPSLLTKSTDFSSVVRMKERQAGAAQQQGPSFASRSSRFYSLKYPDTRHVLAPVAGTSNWAEGSECMMRKSDTGYLEYQLQDRSNKARLLEQHKQRFDATSRLESTWSSQSCEGWDEARLESKRLQHQRYIERQRMYDDARQMDDLKSNTIFGRFYQFHVPAEFGQIKSLDAALP